MSGFGTRTIHAGEGPDRVHGTLHTPMDQSSTFVVASPEQGARRFAGAEGGYAYSLQTTVQRLALGKASRAYPWGWRTKPT